MTEYVKYHGNRYKIDYTTTKTTNGGHWYVSFGLIEVKLRVLLLICATIVGIVLILKSYYNSCTIQDDEKNISYSWTELQSDTASTNLQRASSFSYCGMVFPDSNERYLTDRDIDSLNEIAGYTERELLRYAINELYARHNYLFQTKKYADHYNKYGFDGYYDAETAVAHFNEYERANLLFLCNIEKARGYR